jgi:hypothetical protein
MATFDGQVRGSRGLCKTNPACSCIWPACTTPSATVEGKLDVSRRCPVLELSGRVPARRVMLGLGRVSNGAPPCPANQSRPLPRWASRSARIRSMSSVSIDAVLLVPETDVVTRPARSAARRNAAVPDRHEGFVGEHQLEPQAASAWSRCAADARQVRPPEADAGHTIEYSCPSANCGRW